MALPITWSGSEGIDAKFLEMMPDTIVFNAGSAIDKYGKRTYGGTQTSARGRIVNESQLMKDTEGQDIVTSGRVYLYGPYVSLTLGDKITLPDGKTPVIVKINTTSDTGGNHHTVVHFGV